MWLRKNGMLDPIALETEPPGDGPGTAIEIVTTQVQLEAGDYLEGRATTWR